MMERMLKWKGDPAFAWTYMLMTVVYLVVIHENAERIMLDDGGNAYAMTCLLTVASIMYFAAMVEKIRIKRNGAESY